MTKLKTLHDGFIESLRDVYSAENQLLKALPKLEKRATDHALKSAFKSHLTETEGQVKRLDNIGEILNTRLTGKTCKAMQGLIEEGKEAIELDSKNEALVDVMLIGAAQRVEHYEMAAYGALILMATELELTDIVKMLQENMAQEVAAGRSLNSLCKDGILQLANVSSNEDDMARDTDRDTDRDTGRDMDDERTERGAKKGEVVRRSKSGPVGRAAAMLVYFSILGLGVIVNSARAETAAQQDIQARQSANTFNPSNSGKNVRDNTERSVTASDQKLGGDELKVVAQIRRGIISNKELSLSGHNVKIIVEGNRVFLKGPVASESERLWIEKRTRETARNYTIVNELELNAG